VFSFSPHPFYPQRKRPKCPFLSFKLKAGWTLEPVWILCTKVKSLSPARNGIVNPWAAQSAALSHFINYIILFLQWKSMQYKRPRVAKNSSLSWSNSNLSGNIFNMGSKDSEDTGFQLWKR